MKIAPWLGTVLVLGFAVSESRAISSIEGRFLLQRVNRRLHGLVVDHTDNHGADRRIWSDALGQLRDLYVYLPPGFDPNQRYPVALWLHGFREDETAFLDYVVDLVDRAIVSGQLPPVIVACPDGTLRGKRTWLLAGSFYVNSKAGRFEDYVIQDVWRFVTMHYPIRPEPEAHALIGASMGGFGAFNLAFKYPGTFKIALGLFPPLNLRWVDCHDRYRSNFDPCCWGWRTKLRSHEVVACFAGIPVCMWQLIGPIHGSGPDAIDAISAENPIELLERLDIKPGQLSLYVAYAGKDQFNIDAQVESFLEVARQRGIQVDVGYEPNGKHSLRTGLKLFPGIAAWLNDRLRPFAVKSP